MSSDSNCVAQSAQYVKTSTPRSDSRRTATHPWLSPASGLRPQSSHCITCPRRLSIASGFHKKTHTGALPCALGSTDGERLVTGAGTSCPADARVTTGATAYKWLAWMKVSPQQQFARAPPPRSRRTVFVATMPRGPSVVLPLPRIGRAAAFTSDAAPGRLGQGARVERRVASI